jgi:hypothetical protein
VLSTLLPGGRKMFCKEVSTRGITLTCGAYMLQVEWRLHQQSQLFCPWTWVSCLLGTLLHVAGVNRWCKDQARSRTAVIRGHRPSNKPAQWSSDTHCPPVWLYYPVKPGMTWLGSAECSPDSYRTTVLTDFVPCCPCRLLQVHPLMSAASW